MGKALVPRRRGFHWDAANSELEIEVNGTKVVGTTDSALTITPATTITGALVLSSTLSVGGIAYTFPAADGSNGQQLTTDGSLTLSWAAASRGEYKDDLGLVSNEEALQTIMDTPVHNYRFNPEKLPVGQYCSPNDMVGVFAEEAPWAMQGDELDVFSSMNAIGTLTAAVKALGKRIEECEAKC